MNVLVINDFQVLRRILDGRKGIFEEEQEKKVRKDGVSQRKIKAGICT